MTRVVDERELIQLIPALRGRALTVSPLEGGLTNRNFRIDADGESYVLRVAGKDTTLLGIDRACEVACSRAAAAAGVGPEIVAYLPEHYAMLRRFVAGRALNAGWFHQPGALQRVLTTLRRYHNGPTGTGLFSPFATVRKYHALARERGVALPDGVRRALDRLIRIEWELRSDAPPCPCHNDLLGANIIDDGVSPLIIDWEYAGMGDRYFDLGNLAAGSEFGAEDERAALAVYFGNVQTDDLRRLRLMRMASDLREAMWGFLQSSISTLNVDYPEYGRRYLERFLTSSQRIEAVQE